ncbi:hypothetical protein ACTXT7_008328 [Hymenolepis weldensis]
MARFKCEICNRRYRMKSLFILHVKFEHPGENHLECNLCEGRFGTFYLLLGHYIIQHQEPDDWNYAELAAVVVTKIGMKVKCIDASNVKE